MIQQQLIHKLKVFGQMLFPLPKMYRKHIFFTSGLKHYIMYAFITYCSNIAAVVGDPIVFLDLVTRASGTIYISTRIR
jgi:hypothetical protein